MFAAALAVVGCGTAPELSPGRPADVQPGPLLELLKVRATTEDKLRVMGDTAGRMHVRIDSELWVLDGGSWRAPARTVWQDPEVGARSIAFVEGAPVLGWTFTVPGQVAGGRPARWVWRRGGGGYPGGAAVVFPCTNRRIEQAR